MSLIFERSACKRLAHAQVPMVNGQQHLPQHVLRTTIARLPECSELQVVRHYTQLSQQNFSIDTHFYPLGSCTMKYNPRGVQQASMQDGFINRHPLTPINNSQALLALLYQLQLYIADITGMKQVALTPMAGAQGEFAGVAMIKAYHEANQDFHRTQIIIPDAAHGTNPASAAMCGMDIIEIPTGADGDINLEVLQTKLSDKTAGIMLTNPSTLGLFAKNIRSIASLVHQAGGLLYYDGANLNAIVGQVRPGDMGFDVMHLNLHKTFATPHGGGGPGAGPVAVNEKLAAYLPHGMVDKNADGYFWTNHESHPCSIGRLSCFMGNINMLLRAYFYIRNLGNTGIRQISAYAALNANYLLHELMRMGYQAAYPQRRASHEFILSLQQEKQTYGISAMDVAKRLLDFGFHAPTTYFPLLVPECLLIEPTETECIEELDAFLSAMQQIRHEIINEPEKLKQAPHLTRISRLDEVKNARDLNLNFYGKSHFFK